MKKKLPMQSDEGEGTHNHPWAPQPNFLMAKPAK